MSYSTRCQVVVPEGFDLEAPDVLATLQSLIEQVSAKNGHPCPVPEHCAEHSLWTLRRAAGLTD